MSAGTVDTRWSEPVEPRKVAAMTLRPVLLPGGDVVRRDARRLTVVGRPDVVLADRPGLVALLRLLDGRSLESVERLAGERVPELEDDPRSVVQQLLARGALRAGPPPRLPRLSVRIRAWAGSEHVAQVVAGAVDALGLRPDPVGDAALLVLVAAGEPDRLWVSRAVETGLPVLPVVVDEHRARVGPLTVAGRTSCLGCHDAARATADPTWAAVVGQLGRPLVAAPPPSPGPVLLHRVAAAVAEQTAACAGPDRPETVGGVLHLRGREVVREVVPVHEGCTSLLHRDA